MQNIIACIDASKQSEYVADAAAWAAKTIDAPLVMLHTIEKSATSNKTDLSGAIGFGSREHLLDELTHLDEERAKLAQRQGKLLLEAAREHVEALDVEAVSVTQRHGDLVEALQDLEDQARLIVLGRCGEDHANDLNVIGSHIESAARTLHRPILITVDKFQQPSSFMIAYDGRETADKALERIIASPLLKGMHCHLVNVKRPDQDINQAFISAKHKLESAGFVVSAERLGGNNIYESLQNYRDSNGIELMVMGAYAHSKVRQFFVGSNTTKMIMASPIPLLILR